MSGLVLVTGANGFIGVRLVQYLSAHEVAVRRSSRGIGDDIDVVSGDIDANTDWSSALAGVACVVHLAARAHVTSAAGAEELSEFRRVNTDGCLNLAAQAAAAGVARFVYLSSIGVNGAFSRRPFNEQDTPDPVTPYAISKWEAEQGLHKIGEETAMEVVIIRPPLVYGPKAPGNFGRLERLLRSGLPLPLGGLRKQRSLVALDNLVSLIAVCIDSPRAANQTFLVCDGEDISTVELLRKMAKALGRTVILLPLPSRLLVALASLVGKQAEVRQLGASLQVDCSKARTLLGWTPVVTLDEGLRLAMQDSRTAT